MIFKKNKLIAIVLVTIATLISLGIDRTRINILSKQNIESLDMKLSFLRETIDRWDEANIEALKNLSGQPGMISMDAAKQKPILSKFVDSYDHIYLAFSMDTSGNNLARSDNNAPKNYRDRPYFGGILLGKKLTYQTLIGRSNNLPTLCMGAPIEQEQQLLLGATIICANLQSLSAEIGDLSFGKNGSVYLFDRDAKLLAHPNTTWLRGDRLFDLSDFPPVKNIVENRNSRFEYDDQNKQWISFGQKTKNGWGVLLTAPKSEVIPESNLPIIILFGALAVSFILFIDRFSQNPIIDSVNRSPRNNKKPSVSLPPKPKQITRLIPPKIEKTLQPHKPQKIHQSSSLSREKKKKTHQTNIQTLSLNVSKSSKQKKLFQHFSPQILLAQNSQKPTQYSQFLEILGATVVQVEDGKSGLSLATEQKFDLIITHTFLSQSCGLRMAKNLREIEQYKNTPIIALGQKNILEKAPSLLTNFDDYLEEPVKPERLISVLKTHLIDKKRIVFFRKKVS